LIGKSLFFKVPCNFKSIYQLNSFVDKDKIIINTSYDELKKKSEGRVSKREEYINYLQKVRVDCLGNSINYH